MIILKYNVTIEKKDLSKLNKLEIEEMISKDDTIKFKTNEKSLKHLLNNIEKIKYENERKKRICSFIKKYFISIIFMLLIILLLINESLIVKEIVFVNENTYDKNVQTYIEKNYKKVLIFNYLNKSLNDLNDELRNNFYYYEWINVYKKGNKLLVTIDKQDEKSFINSKSKIKGDIISKHDGIIRYFFVKEGVSLIKDNKSVKAGDILVSGNLGYYNETSDKYIHPCAIVLAEFANKETIKVKKQEQIFLRTGRIKNDYFYSCLKKEKDFYDLYEYEDQIVYNFFGIKKIKRTYFEINSINITYDKDEGFLYASSVIDKKFNENKVHKKEKIIEKELINSFDDENYFYYTFLVKKIANVAEFQALRLEEK